MEVHVADEQRHVADLRVQLGEGGEIAWDELAFENKILRRITRQP